MWTLIITALIAFGAGIAVTCATFMWACNDGGLETPFEPWWDQ